MSKQDRQKLSILIVLLGVLGLVVVLAYRMNQPSITAAVQPTEAKPAASSPAVTEAKVDGKEGKVDAKIRLDLVNKPENADDIGKKDVFQYRQAPPPPTPAAIRGPSVAPSPSQPNPFGRPPTSVSGGGPPSPPLPPPIPLKYLGYVALDTPGGALTAVLSDDQRHFNVTAGEVLMGRYHILAVSDKVVDVEDLEYKRRQSLPVAK